VLEVPARVRRRSVASLIIERAGLCDNHHATIRRNLARYRGREIKTTGDGILATFDGPARGVLCACVIVALQRPGPPIAQGRARRMACICGRLHAHSSNGRRYRRQRDGRRHRPRHGIHDQPLILVLVDAEMAGARRRGGALRALDFPRR
jgi:class 3 adenylate cyclase